MTHAQKISILVILIFALPLLASCGGGGGPEDTQTDEAVGDPLPDTPHDPVVDDVSGTEDVTAEAQPDTVADTPADTPAEEAAPAVVTVHMTAGMRFDPADVTINAGETVEWINDAGVPHTSTSGTACTPDGGWDSGTLNSGQRYSHTFSAAGTFPYYCTFHCAAGMTGTVTVNP